MRCPGLQHSTPLGSIPASRHETFRNTREAKSDKLSRRGVVTLVVYQRTKTRPGCTALEVGRGHVGCLPRHAKTAFLSVVDSQHEGFPASRAGHLSSPPRRVPLADGQRIDAHESTVSGFQSFPRRFTQNGGPTPLTKAACRIVYTNLPSSTDFKRATESTNDEDHGQCSFRLLWMTHHNFVQPGVLGHLGGFSLEGCDSAQR